MRAVKYMQEATTALTGLESEVLFEKTLTGWDMTIICGSVTVRLPQSPVFVEFFDRRCPDESKRRFATNCVKKD